MCGLAAILRLDGGPLGEHEREMLDTMTDALAHRGPDGRGIYVDGPIGLGHRLLRINGNQAQPLVADDGAALALVGEIYRPKAGHGREVTLALHLLREARRPSDAFARMNAMFAIAFWDGRRLTLARDRLGEKPLFWTIRDGLVLAASEIKALASVVRLAPDFEALAERRRLHLLYGERTMFRGIRRVEPGSSVLFGPGAPDGERTTYWQPPAEDGAGPDADELRAILADAIRIRATADAPIACALSGGLDSSLVAVVSELEPWHGYFQESAYSERRWARAAVPRRVQEVKIRPGDFEREIGAVVRALDEPLAGPGAFAEWMVAKRAAESGVRVMLGGYGGDEVWGGYARQRIIAGALPGYEGLERSAYGAMVSREPGLVADLGSGYEGKSPLSRACRWETTATLRALLEVSDRVSAAHAIETRSPLLDPRLVEAVFAGGDRLRKGGGAKGFLLPLAMDLGVPAAIAKRRDKMGFPVPLAEWAQGPLRGFLWGILRRDPAGLAAREIWGELSLRLWAAGYGFELSEIPTP